MESLASALHWWCHDSGTRTPVRARGVMAITSLSARDHVQHAALHFRVGFDSDRWDAMQGWAHRVGDLEDHEEDSVTVGPLLSEERDDCPFHLVVHLARESEKAQVGIHAYRNPPTEPPEDVLADSRAWGGFDRAMEVVRVFTNGPARADATATLSVPASAGLSPNLPLPLVLDDSKRLSGDGGAVEIVGMTLRLRADSAAVESASVELGTDGNVSLSLTFPLDLDARGEWLKTLSSAIMDRAGRLLREGGK